MNITDSANPQTQANTSTSSLAKPSGSMSENSKQSSPETLDKMTSDDLVALVNIIVLLISGIRSPSAGGGNVGGSPFNSSSGSNFILDFPTLPTMNHSSEGGSEGNSKDGTDSENSKGLVGSSSSSSSSLNMPPLPSFNLGNSVDSGPTSTDGSTGAAGGSTGSSDDNSNNNGTILKTRPLSSLVSTTGSLSTAGASRAFNPPPIPSLLGNSTQLPSVNAANSALSTGLSTSPQSSSVAGSSATNSGGSSSAGNTTLDTNQLPSLVSPATGSLSTPDVPKAFNPPSIPSLTGGSVELPLVSASDSKPISTGLSSSTSTPVSSNTSTSIFNVPAIPSLLGSGGTIDSLVASLQSGTSTSGSSSNSNDQNAGGSNSHWKGGS